MLALDREIKVERTQAIPLFYLVHCWYFYGKRTVAVNIAHARAISRFHKNPKVANARTARGQVHDCIPAKQLNAALAELDGLRRTAISKVTTQG